LDFLDNYCPAYLYIPVLAASFSTGMMFKYAPSAQVNIYTNTLSTFVPTSNIIVDSKYGDGNNIVVVGSHLDSVPAGPGINDNGSGSALNLELALQLGPDDVQKTLRNKVRFAWWGAEELGLLGSNYYVANLTLAQRQEIAVNLNFDMVGSPNFIRGVYNGTSNPSPPGSAVLQTLFNNYFESVNLQFQPTPFTNRSDYTAFLAANISAGGLFTGADETKSTSERVTYGGLANTVLDPCYHQSCDTTDNIDQTVFGDMGKAAANVLYNLATASNLRHLLKLQ